MSAPDFGEHLAGLAADGQDVSAPVPVRHRPSASADLVKALGDHPDLRIGDEGVVWRDSLGRDHVLSGSKRLTFGEAAQKLNRSIRTVHDLAAEGKLGPVLRFSRRDVQLYACCVDDYEHHGLRGKEVAHA